MKNRKICENGIIREMTPEEIAECEALPNPNALNFTGAVTGRYDGSTPLSVKIPTVDDVLAALPTWEGGSY